MMPSNRFWIIDGANWFYRFYHAPFNDLTSPSGEPVKAVYQFCKQTLDLLNKHDPTHIAVVFDGERNNLFRRHIDPDYKSGRGVVSQEIKTQIGRCQQFVEAIGIQWMQCEGYEADDLMASLATKFCHESNVVLVTRDKDLFYMLERQRVLLFDHFDGHWYSAKECKSKFGVRPFQIPEYLALVGDSCDSIPGVKGWGKKIAAKWLSSGYDRIDDLLADVGRLPKKLGDSLVKANRSGKLDQYRQLARLDCKVRISNRLSDFSCKNLDLENARPLYRELGFRSLLKESDERPS